MTSEIRARLGAGLHALKKRRGLGYAAIVEVSGVSERTVKAAFAGSQDVAGGRLDAICCAMGATVAQLLALGASADYTQSDG